MPESGSYRYWDRDIEPGAEKITAKAKELGLKGCGKVLNIADRVQTDAFAAEVEKEFGAVSVLINNAGITRDTLAPLE